MSLQPLDEVRRALSGAWDLTRAGFWWRTAEAAANDGQWGVAANRLLHLADAMDSVPSYSAAWRQLCVAALDASVRADSEDLVRTVCAQTLANAFDAQSEAAELRGLFRTASEVGALGAGAVLGELVQQRLPACPWGPLGAGHFWELRFRAGENVPVGRIVGWFDRAAQIFGAHTPTGRHAALRAAVATIAYTTRTDQGRDALRAVANDVTEVDGAWLAYGRTFSPFWLDRIRAADWVTDTLDAPAFRDERSLAAARGVLDALLANLPPQLTDPEIDRLRAVAEQVEEPYATALTEQLNARVAVGELAADPLESLTAGHFGEEPLLRDAQALAMAWRGEAPPTPPREAISAAVAQLLLEGATAERLKELAELVRATSARDALRPVSLMLLRVVSDAETAPLTEEIAVHFAHRGPVPSFGFLPLAGRCFSASLPRAGAALTERAVDSGERGELVRICVARSVHWACGEATDRDLLRWLERGEALLD